MRTKNALTMLRAVPHAHSATATRYKPRWFRRESAYRAPLRGPRLLPPRPGATDLRPDL